jgi:predicted HTH domain antitoxin
MAITFQFPVELEKRIRAEGIDLDAEAREASALELFRRGRLSHFELSQVLGLDRFETDAYLNNHNVVEQTLTTEDLEEQGRALDRVLGPVRR